MGKAIDGDISEDQWLTGDEKIFTSNGFSLDAHLYPCKDERLYRMKKAFKLSADILVDYSERFIHERNNLIWPVLYSYRHYIELSLKDVINNYGKCVVPAINSNYTKHCLKTLWTDYRKLLNSLPPEFNDRLVLELGVMEECVKDLAKVDSGSFTFRYPTDTKCNLNNVDMHSLDLLNTKKVMGGIFLLLDVIETMLHEYFIRDCNS